MYEKRNCSYPIINPNQFQDSRISSSNSVVQGKTNLTFTIFPKSFVPEMSTVMIKFPNDFQSKKIF